MKKVISKVVALVAVFAMVSCTAFAATTSGPISAEKKNGVVTVKVSELQSGEETSLLVTKGNASIDEAFADTTKVYHIDQVAAADDGVSTFTFNHATADAITIYSGHALMGATDDPYYTDDVKDESVTPTPDPEPDPDPDPEPEDPKFKYGDVNNDTDVDVMDASAVIANYLNGTDFIDSETDEVYAYGATAADVNGDTDVDVMDASAIIAYFLNGTQFPVLEEK